MRQRLKQKAIFIGNVVENAIKNCNNASQKHVNQSGYQPWKAATTYCFKHSAPCAPHAPHGRASVPLRDLRAPHISTCLPVVHRNTAR